MDLDNIYKDEAPLKRAIIWTGSLDDLPDWKVKDNVYVPISTVLEKEEPTPDPEPEPFPTEDFETIYINPECRVNVSSDGYFITIDDSTKITTNTFLLHLVDTTSHGAVKNNVPERSATITSLNSSIWEKYLNVDGGKELKPFTIKAIYDDEESTPHYWKVVYKAGRYFIITGIRTSSSNNERTSSQYVIQKAEVNESGYPGIVYYLQLTDGYNVIS